MIYLEVKNSSGKLFSQVNYVYIWPKASEISKAFFSQNAELSRNSTVKELCRWSTKENNINKRFVLHKKNVRLRIGAITYGQGGQTTSGKSLTALKIPRFEKLQLNDRQYLCNDEFMSRRRERS